MGWLELLPLLKRVLPLLSRMVPMLETVVATRAASRAEGEGALNRVLAEVKTQQGAHGEHALRLQQLITAQGEQISTMAADLNAVRVSHNAQAERIAQVERQLHTIGRLLRMLAIATVVLLLACIALLAMLVARHA